MTSTLTTLALVRPLCGIPSTKLGDSDLQSIIDQTEAEIYKHFDTRFTPTTEVENLFLGNSTREAILSKKPVLRIKAISIDGTSVTPAFVAIRSSNSGSIYLMKNAEVSFWAYRDYNLNHVQYDYGMIEIDYSVSTISNTSALTASTSAVTIAVASTTGFSAGDYVRIAGTDGFDEIAKINSLVVNTSITVDSLSQPHAASSTIWRIQVPLVVKNYAAIVASIGAIANLIGANFNAVADYEIDLTKIRKGESYQQWHESMLQLINKRDKLEAMIRKVPTMW